jgi:hypothetical protein
MLAVVVQLPAGTLEPKASAGSDSASSAQMMDTTDLVLMAKPPLLVWVIETRVAPRRGARPYKSLKPELPQASVLGAALSESIDSNTM